jgi:hypothetical protein
LAQLVGVTERELRALVRVSFAKVAEYQQRGAVHFHAIRLDAATDCAYPACVVAPPPAGFTAELLEAAVRKAADAVTVPCPVLDDDQGVTLTARWGEQLDVRYITETGDDEGSCRLSRSLARWPSTRRRAPRPWHHLDHRVGEVELEGLDVPATWLSWSGPAGNSAPGRRWRACAAEVGAHAWLRRHFSSRSRRYSTTLGALRRARVAYAIRRRRGDTLPAEAWGRPEDDRAVLVVASWAYLGSGYQSTGEAWLAASAAARARGARRIAKEESYEP